jgi:hypothetical protein
VLSLALLNLGFVSAVVAMVRPDSQAVPPAAVTPSPGATALATLPPATEIPLPTPVIGATPTPAPSPRPTPTATAPRTDTGP